MTEQELRQQLIKAAYEWSISSGNEGMDDVVMPICKAYADARIETETKELEDDYAELKMIHDKFYESDALQHKEILSLNAELKRLRDGIQKEIDIQTELRDTGINTGQVFDSVLKVRRCVVDALELLLSPEPVTDGNEAESPCRTCLRIRSTIEGYCKMCDTDFSPKNEEQL